MDHQEQHHEHHKKEREHEKHLHKQHAQGKGTGRIHPSWFLVLGVVLVSLVVVVWILSQ
jgi:hypothetical protein